MYRPSDAKALQGLLRPPRTDVNFPPPRTDRKEPLPPTPLYTALRAFAAQQPRRFHMPGHHGQELPLPELAGYAKLDFTELPTTGDLYEAGGIIEAAENLWAQRFGAAHCLFLTNGATQGLHAALALACPIGGGVLLDRGSHRSLYNAVALLDLRPTYLPRPWREIDGVSGPIEPQAVEEALEKQPEIKTVCITSPTYYGVLSDISAIAKVVHNHGARLIVDGAHGAHLPFFYQNPYEAADLFVVSAHKTLPAPGQAALLFSGEDFSMDDLRRVGAIYGTSSPSYPIMAALDVCRAYMQEEGATEYERAALRVGALRLRFPSLTEKNGLKLDPTRFVWRVQDGFAALAKLQKLGIYPEMADSGHVIFIFTCADKEDCFTDLGAAMRRCKPDRMHLSRANAAGAHPLQLSAPPPLPEQACTPRTALFAPHESTILEEADGRICAQQVAPYPPGVPVIAPGERIEKKHLSYLQEIGYNTGNTILVLQ